MKPNNMEHDMIDAIIVNYLKTNKRLVIPDFGAFIRKDTGEIVFMEFLKKDDGVLLTLLGSELGLSEADSREVIYDYIKTIKDVVAEEGSYSAKELGFLQKDANGNFELVSVAAPQPPRTGSTTPSAAPAPQQPSPQQGLFNQPDTTPTPAPTQALAVPSQASAKTTTPVIPPAPANTGTEARAAQPARPIQATEAVSAAPTTPASPGKITPPAASGSINTNTATAPPAPKPLFTSQSPAPARKSTPQYPTAKPKKKRADLIIIIAIIAALIAIGSMVYGVLVNSDPIIKMQSTTPVEQADEGVEVPQDGEPMHTEQE